MVTKLLQGKLIGSDKSEAAGLVAIGERLDSEGRMVIRNSWAQNDETMEATTNALGDRSVRFAFGDELDELVRRRLECNPGSFNLHGRGGGRSGLEKREGQHPDGTDA